MAQVRSWAGLDVHARSVLAVTLDAESGELRSCRLSGETAQVVEFCAALPGPTRVAYEAGPTGYGLARALHVGGDRVCGGGAGKDRAPGAGQGQDRSARRRAGTAAADDRRAAHGAGSDRRGGGAPRSRASPGGRARRSDARQAAAEQAAAAPRHHLRGHIEHLDPASPRLAARTGPRGRRAGDAAGLPRRDRHARAAPRHARGHDHRARPGLAVRADRRQVAVPARDRHALRRRPGGRDRRLRPVPARRTG